MRKALVVFLLLFPNLPVVVPGLQLLKMLGTVSLIAVVSKRMRMNLQVLVLCLFVLLCLVVLVIWNLDGAYLERYVKLAIYILFAIFYYNYILNAPTIGDRFIWFLIAAQVVLLILQTKIEVFRVLYSSSNLIALQRSTGFGVNHHDAGLLVAILFCGLSTRSHRAFAICGLIALVSSVLSGSKTGLIFNILFFSGVLAVRVSTVYFVGGVLAIVLAAIFGFQYVICTVNLDMCSAINSVLDFAQNGTTNYLSIVNRMEDWRVFQDLIRDRPLAMIFGGVGEGEFSRFTNGSDVEVGLVSYFSNYGIIFTVLLGSIFVAIARKTATAEFYVLASLLLMFEFLINVSQNSLIFILLIFVAAHIRRQRKSGYVLS